MEKDTNVIFRINSTLKENVMRLAKERGVSLSELITACLMDVDHRNMIPINLNKYLPNRYAKESAVTLAFIKLCLNDIIEKQEKKLIRKAYLFGSYARGEETSKSDIDIRLEADDGLTLVDIGNIRQDLVDATKKDVDLLVIDPSKLDKEFYENIRKDQICIYER